MYHIEQSEKISERKSSNRIICKVVENAGDQKYNGKIVKAHID